MSKQERFRAGDGALLVVDVQEKLLPSIRDRDHLLTQVIRLIRGAGILEIPTFATEQYPKGLGPTVPELAGLILDRAAKTTFHALGAPGISESLASRGIRHVTLVGIEAHVCIAQTSLELLRLGYEVQVPADAVGSRFAVDYEFALRRLERAGAVVSTTESVLFEWTEGAEHPKFKQISALVKERTGE
ncbi:hydrolase [Tundrisphaera lichenicola]|uniref:hydrolase n=1 Tax=Tundrisphaera lichenicola TaxID=2029860 RepID=UPI003EBB8373